MYRIACQKRVRQRQPTPAEQTTGTFFRTIHVPAWPLPTITAVLPAAQQMLASIIALGCNAFATIFFSVAAFLCGPLDHSSSCGVNLFFLQHPVRRTLARRTPSKRKLTWSTRRIVTSRILHVCVDISPCSPGAGSVVFCDMSHCSMNRSDPSRFLRVFVPPFYFILLLTLLSHVLAAMTANNYLTTKRFVYHRTPRGCHSKFLFKNRNDKLAAWTHELCNYNVSKRSGRASPTL